MQAAILHEAGAALSLERVPRPQPRGGELLIRVRAAAALPHQRLAFSGTPPFRLPELPTPVGWDVSGEVVEVGQGVSGFGVGDRVYIRPIITCNNCDACRRGAPLSCDRFMLLGGFGLSEGSLELQRHHRGGGFAELMCAPATNAVHLPEHLSFDDATRLGYAGVSFRALRRGGVGLGKRVVIVGATGNLGVPATGLALSMGADRVIAVARDEQRLGALRAWASDPRLSTISITAPGGTLAARMSALWGGRSADVVIDLLDSSRGTPPRSVEAGLACLAPNGVAVFAGAILEPPSFDYMALVTGDRTLTGSHGYDMADARDLITMIRSGIFTLPPFETLAFSLSQVNEALDVAWSRPGGLTNVVVRP